MRLFRSANTPCRRIVFYAEHRIYFRYFQGILEALTEQSDLTITYLTSDPDDPILRGGHSRIRPLYVNSLLPFVILLLDAKVLVMTMSDLHRFHIRRSMRGAHHAYVFHALVSTHMVYRGRAFDHYDSILCVGPHQRQELERARERSGRPQATLFNAGYPWLDALHAGYQRHLEHYAPPAGRRPLALIAPSWGASNILETCVNELVTALGCAGFRVLVRPHPETAKRQPRLVAELERACADRADVAVDLNFLSERSLFEADVLITDWSGIALEYAFATERPVLYIDTPRKVHNPTYEAHGLVPLEVKARDHLGEILKTSEAGRVGEVAARLIETRATYRERIRTFRARSVYHLGDAARVSAQQILALCRDDGSAVGETAATDRARAGEAMTSSIPSTPAIATRS